MLREIFGKDVVLKPQNNVRNN